MILNRFRSRSPRIRLLKMMPARSICAEVGTWKGDFAAQILRNVDPLELHLIDPWKARAETRYAEAQYGGKRSSQKEMDLIFDSVLKRFARDIRVGTVKIHRCPSAEAREELPDDSLDWVYIDGDHTYEVVLQDLIGFASKVKSGGYIAGDDYGVRGWWQDGVTRAVDEFVESGAADFRWRQGAQFILQRLPQ